MKFLSKHIFWTSIDIRKFWNLMEMLQDLWHCEICNCKPGRGFGMLLLLTASTFFVICHWFVRVALSDKQNMLFIISLLSCYAMFLLYFATCGSKIKMLHIYMRCSVIMHVQFIKISNIFLYQDFKNFVLMDAWPIQSWKSSDKYSLIEFMRHLLQSISLF